VRQLRRQPLSSFEIEYALIVLEFPETSLKQSIDAVLRNQPGASATDAGGAKRHHNAGRLCQDDETP